MEGEDKKGALEEYKDGLESLAVSTWIDLLSNQLIDPKVRKETADSVMKALGKDAPPKAAPMSVVFNVEMKKAVGGIDTFQKLLDRPEED